MQVWRDPGTDRDLALLIWLLGVWHFEAWCTPTMFASQDKTFTISTFFEFVLAKRKRFDYLALQMATKPSPKVTLAVRIPPEIQELFRQQAEADDIPISAFARRMFKLGVAAYSQTHDSVLGEFVQIWRDLNEHQRVFLLKFAELVRSNHIDVYPQDAQTSIPILAPIDKNKPHK